MRKNWKEEKTKFFQEFLILYDIVCWKLDSSVVIALGYGLVARGIMVRLLTGTKRILLRYRVQIGLGVHTTSNQRVLGSLPGGFVWPGRRADKSPPSSAEIRTVCILRSVPTGTPHDPFYKVHNKYEFVHAATFFCMLPRKQRTVFLLLVAGNWNARKVECRMWAWIVLTSYWKFLNWWLNN